MKYRYRLVMIAAIHASLLMLGSALKRKPVPEKATAS
jgi:hypothetical protein